ncbi:toll/interleukin-1 receptor domain-containing protein [Pseudoroseomonas sp. WGS1072]|uniref:toll/interleukin-1 receptor domain-containing protein n=1 Tax=Roseomonas sp. WGS1072 TaxID=3366816 RepID=UPI003BF15923
MTAAAPIERDLIFISKATPGDDQFVLWLAPRLEAAGYKVFADIFDLDAGDEWRGKLTAALQSRAVKMLLCCSDETLARRGVREEISIAEDQTKQLQDPNFIIPLKIRTFQKLFGIGGLQYVDFERGWAKGLASLLRSLERQQVPKAGGGIIQPEWYAYLRRRAVEIEATPEVLTSNWLRIVGMPEKLNYLVSRNRADSAVLRKLGASFEFPMAEFGDGFLTFANPFDLTEHFERVGPFRIERDFDLLDFIENGSADAGIESRDAKSIMMNLLRQAWEKHCARERFLAHTFSSGLSFHVGEDKLALKKRVSWGRQGERRNSMLRGVSRKKIWEYGVSVIPSLFPYPHMRLKGRVLFSDIGERNKAIVIPDTKAQFRLRRSVCSGWRNKAWHGRVMAFMELLAGESPYVGLAVGSGGTITLDAMPIQFMAPVTARQTNRLGEDAEEPDETTLGGHYEDEDV